MKQVISVKITGYVGVEVNAEDYYEASGKLYEELSSNSTLQDAIVSCLAENIGSEHFDVCDVEEFYETDVVLQDYLDEESED